MPESYFESTHFKLPGLTGNNPIHDIGTGFKKLAEKIDEVLWELVNHKVETAKLKVTETLEPPKGFALVETENTYGGLTNRTSGTEYEPNATRFTFVTIQMHNTSNGTGGIESAVYVGGVEIARPGYYPVTADNGLSGNVAYSFYVPPGKKWKAEVVATGGGAAELKSSYLTL